MLLLAVCCALSSCGVLYGGKITHCQAQKPKADEPKREIRPAAFTFDLLFFPIISLPVDFATGAIYKPCQNEAKQRK